MDQMIEVATCLGFAGLESFRHSRRPEYGTNIVAFFKQPTASNKRKVTFSKPKLQKKAKKANAMLNFVAVREACALNDRKMR